MTSSGKEILDPQKTTIARKQEPEMPQKYFQAHAEKLCALFDALAEAQLTVKPEKCHLFKKTGAVRLARFTEGPEISQSGQD